MSQEEKKAYSIIGRVEIGTDEYRDLIEGRLEANERAETYNSKRWEECRRADKAEEKLKKVSSALELYKEFVNGSEIVKAEYIRFLSEKRAKEEGEEK